jgi:hypothetical protein
VRDVYYIIIDRIEYFFRRLLCKIRGHRWEDETLLLTTLLIVACGTLTEPPQEPVTPDVWANGPAAGNVISYTAEGGFKNDGPELGSRWPFVFGYEGPEYQLNANGGSGKARVIGAKYKKESALIGEDLYVHYFYEWETPDGLVRLYVRCFKNGVLTSCEG